MEIRAHIRRVASAVAATMVLVACRGSARAYDAQLGWTAVTAAAGYKVYIRQASQPYGAGINVGNPISGNTGTVGYVTTGVPSDQITYFAVTSYTATGLESAFSNELSLVPSQSGFAPTPTANSALVGGPGTPTATPTPTATRLLAYVPSSRNNLACELVATTNILRLGACLATCEIRSAAAAFAKRSFDEQGCKTTAPLTSCQARYDAAAAKLVTAAICPPCLDAAQHDALAAQTVADFAQGESQIHCAGSVAADAKMLACEQRVAVNVLRLGSCLLVCDAKAVGAAFLKRPFNRQSCQMLVCRTKYTLAQTALVKVGVCPLCLAATQQTALADQTAVEVAQTSSRLYCAGTTPLGP